MADLSTQGWATQFLDAYAEFRDGILNWTSGPITASIFRWELYAHDIPKSRKYHPDGIWAFAWPFEENHIGPHRCTFHAHTLDATGFPEEIVMRRVGFHGAVYDDP